MLKSFKTELFPTVTQAVKIRQAIGTCRYVYNLFLATNKDRHTKGEPFLSGKGFSVLLNNTLLPANPGLSWIRDAPSKAVKKAIMDADTAYRNFFRGRAGFPAFKKKHASEAKMYFVRNNPKDCPVERHRIKVPCLGWVRVKEKGYIPTTASGYVARSGTVSIRAGRYYVSVLVDVPEQKSDKPQGGPVGVDLGLKAFATVSDGTSYANINKSSRIQRLEKQLRRAQRRLARMDNHNKQKGGAAHGANRRSQQMRIQGLQLRLDNIRTDYIRKVTHGIVKTKPSHVAIEDLNVRGMLKNRHLANAIRAQKFREFRDFLTWKCRGLEIEVRIVDRWYPSSKTCNHCGHVKKDLTLRDRTYACPVCGHMEDRDLNAARNLRDARAYTIAV